MSELAKNIQTLQTKVGFYQSSVLDKILFTKESERIYMNSYTPNSGGSTAGSAIGKFLVDGTLRKNGRDRYQLTLHPSGAIKCTCPDAIYNTTKHHHFCKHACFLICRVFHLFDPTIFRQLLLSPEQLQQVLDLSVGLQIETVNQAISQELNQTSSQFICTLPVDSDWTCSICYDDTPPSLSELVSCPQCTKSVHRGCMEVWLEKHSTCVYCRSSCWNKYEF
jgi:hypothetical protein